MPVRGKMFKCFRLTLKVQQMFSMATIVKCAQGENKTQANREGKKNIRHHYLKAKHI